MAVGDRIRIIIGDDEHQVVGKPLTLICASAKLHEQIKYPGRFAIDYDVTRYHAERCQQWHEETASLYESVMEGCQFADGFFTESQLHVAGLIDMSLKLMDMGVPVVWVKPEMSLHPAQCCELGDVAIHLMQKYHKLQENPDDHAAGA